MRAAVGREQLRHGLGHVAPIFAARGAPAGPGTILVAVEAGQLTLSAANVEATVICQVPCDAAASGAVAVSGRLLVDFVAGLPDVTVELESPPGVPALRVRAARDEAAVDATLRGQAADDFPAPPDDAAQVGGQSVTVPAAMLRDLIARTAFAAAGANEGRPALTGVEVRAAGARLTLCATNGERLATSAGDLTTPLAGETAVLVPARTLGQVQRAAAEAREPVRLTVTAGRNQLLCRTPTIAIWARLLDGAFPDWRRLIPAGYATRTVVDRERLDELLLLASYFVRGDEDRVVLAIAPDDGAGGALTVGAAGVATGDHTGRLRAAVTGPAARITLKAQYLRDALAAVGTDRVALETRGPADGAILRPVDVVDRPDAAADHLHLIMPFSPPAFGG